MRPLNDRSASLSGGAAAASLMPLRILMAGRRVARLGETLERMRLPGFGALAATMLVATGAYGVSWGGHTNAVIDAVAVSAGFSIEEIDVEGNEETSEIDVLQALWQTGSQSLLSLDPEAARAAVEALPWVAKASVSKIYPNRVAISLSEHEPLAIWQKGRDLFIIDRQGREIVPYSPGRFSGLPFVVGLGAGESAAELLEKLEALPELRARVKAYIRVADRRWDLRMENGVTIRLPEENFFQAAADVVRMDREKALLSRDILAVDMRIEDRIVIRLTPEALARRKEALERRKEMMERREGDTRV